MLSVRTTILHASTLVAARLLVTFFVWSLGFQALSDDDFARITLSQQFAETPKLDPTGTSWLPFPFWLNGALMAIFGRSLLAAEASAVATACASGLLLYAAARAGSVPPTAAWLGVLVWTFVPSGAFAGAATVPELSTAALCASALILLKRSEAKSGLLAAALLLPATLSRYEAWPVALFAIVTLAVPTTKSNNIVPRAVAIAVAASGPLGWIAWNQIAHDDAFHFHYRVSSYWFALGGQRADWTSLLLYPKLLIVDAPELAASLIGAAWWNTDRKHLRAWLKPALGAMATVAALTLAQGTGGAPTHHPERTLLLVWAVAWITTADLMLGAGAREGIGWDRWRRVWLASVVAFMVVRVNSMSTWYGVRRTDEIALGTWLRDNTQGTVLLSPTDYGYFAVMAASSNPNRIELAGSVDPRRDKRPSPFDQEATLREREDVRWLVARGKHAETAQKIGKRRHEQGPWIVVETPVP